ncbi:MAG TPA: methyltransferase domain-containing protein [Vicinamibacteria bacterium]|nr:methyltransferase domain-containing protein [Vicinamibacteria bacterium]
MNVRRVDYDKVAPVYDRRYRDGGSPEIAALVRAFGATAAGRPVLEVGCGTGRWLSEAHRAGARAVGLDPSPAMLARARALVPAASLVRGRAEALPFRDRLFGAVFCIFVVHHLDDAPRFVAEAARLLDPGGVLGVLALAPHDGQDRWYVYDFFDGVEAADRARYPTTAAIAGWMEAAGLSGVRTEMATRFTRRAEGQAVFEDPILNREGTCQLSLLTDREFERGMERIRAAARRPEATFLTDLRIFATSGRKPEV